MLTVWIVLVVVVISAGPASAGQVMDRVRASGKVDCGVSDVVPGFSYKSADGSRKGFNVDFCRAVAAAVLGDPDKVKFVPVTTANRFPQLLADKIDLLMGNTTYTFEREAALRVQFAGIYYYDQQAVMVPRGGEIRTLADLNGATICLGKSTTHVASLSDYFTQKGWTFKPLLMDSVPEMKDAFVNGQCQAVSFDRTQLTALLKSMPSGMQKYEILPESISQEPVGPVARWEDQEWQCMIKWVLYALIEAEQRGVTQANARTLRDTSDDLGLKRFLAADGLPEKTLGISPGWVLRVIEAVGNYGEIYERHLGSQSELKLERGLNRLWTQGGLLYSPPPALTDNRRILKVAVWAQY